MNTEKIMDALALTDENFRQEAIETMYGKGMKKTGRIVRLLLIAAAVTALLTATAYGIGAYINSPEAAEKVAKQEIEEWKKLGLLSEEVHFDGYADAVVELEETQGDEYFFGRIFPHRYDVRWYNRNEGSKYGCNLSIDTASGKIVYASIDANADETDEPIREIEIENEDGSKRPWYFYNNFDDIFPADMTVNRFCALLAEYWGFEGYTLSDTEDSFYRQDWDAVTGDSLLKDMPEDNYYLTVYFEGDQKGVPMYIQIGRFPGYVSLFLGTNHMVG